MHDALIIGGGPAGSVIGLLLAKAGWSVAIIEKLPFPRRKVCGEYISAATLSLFPELNIAEKFNSIAGPAIKQIELYAGKTIISAPMPENKKGTEQWGHAVGREFLDSILLEEAKNSGASIWQPWTASDLVQQDNHFFCTLSAKNKTTENIAAKMVIMAHGSWEKQTWSSKISKHQPSDLLAFKAHFTHSTLKPCAISLLAFQGGYGGIVQTDNGRTSLSCCVRRDQLISIRQRFAGIHAGDALLQYLFEENDGVRECLSSANREQNWLSVGPIQPGIRTAYKEGIFYVGNIAGEAHPIIAEGISMAIQSAWVLSKILIASKKQHEKNWITHAGREYQKQWEKKFPKRIHAAALFAHLASNQKAVNLLLPLFRIYPKLLSSGAKLSGKINVPFFP